MCNAYEQHVKWVEYCKMMQALEHGILTQQSELDLPESDDVRINDMAPVVRAAGEDIELVPMNFSFPSSGPKGGPVFNFRSEGRSFANSNRCLIPASGFFEFTGKNYPKTKHRFSRFWPSPECDVRVKATTPASFTLLTTEPGPTSQPSTTAKWSCCRRGIGRPGSTSRSQSPSC